MKRTFNHSKWQMCNSHRSMSVLLSYCGCEKITSFISTEFSQMPEFLMSSKLRIDAAGTILNFQINLNIQILYPIYPVILAFSV